LLERVTFISKAGAKVLIFFQLTNIFLQKMCYTLYYNKIFLIPATMESHFFEEKST